jgi:hypothetical protein
MTYLQGLSSCLTLSIYAIINNWGVLATVCARPEPVFVNVLRGQGIDDSQPGEPVRQPYLSYWPVTLQRLEESIPGLLKRLQIRASSASIPRLLKRLQMRARFAASFLWLS